MGHQDGGQLRRSLRAVPRVRGARDADYEKKRADLIDRLIERLSAPNETRPSFRSLAEGVGVTMPTLRHYFGDRDAVLKAVFEEWRRRGEPYIRMAAEPAGPLPESLLTYLKIFLHGYREFALSKVMAVGFIEGMLNETHGPVFLNTALEPSLQALEERLKAHQARGDMRSANARHAALAFLTPVLVACQHQMQFFGSADHPLDLDAFVQDHVDAFVRAYAPEAAKIRRSAARRKPASQL
jgi:AcrR family transcriptional regulator